MAKYSKIIIFILVLLLLIIGQKYKVLKSENDDLSSLVDDYDYSLRQANNNIEEANSMIEDAQGSAWSTYEDMGQALDNLSTVDTVREP